MEINKIKKLTVIAFFLAPLIWLAYRDYRLESSRRFTIDVTTGRQGGGWVGYTFVVNGNVYLGQGRVTYDSVETNKGRYFVVFERDNPSNNRIYWDRPVPITIKDAPSDGWGFMPE